MCPVRIVEQALRRPCNETDASLSRGFRRAIIVSVSLPLFIAFGNYDTFVTIL